MDATSGITTEATKIGASADISSRPKQQAGDLNIKSPTERVKEMVNLFRNKEISVGQIGLADNEYLSQAFGYTETKIDGVKRLRVALPNNLEQFADEQLVIALIHMLDKLDVEYVISSADLSSKVFSFDRSKKQEIVGYISLLSQDMIESFPTEGGSFGKGRRAAIADYLTDHRHTQAWFKNIGANLNGIFTSLVGIRCPNRDFFARIKALIIRRRKEIKAKCLSIFLKTKEQLRQEVIKTKLPFENGGLYTPEEISYFKNHFKEQIDKYNSWIDKIPSMSDDQVSKFDQEYKAAKAPLKPLIDICDTISDLRKPVLYQLGKKSKMATKYNKLSISEKIEKMDPQEYIRLFCVERVLGQPFKFDFKYQNTYVDFSLKSDKTEAEAEYSTRAIMAALDLLEDREKKLSADNQDVVDVANKFILNLRLKYE